jgi:hypothetical protein
MIDSFFTRNSSPHPIWSSPTWTAHCWITIPTVGKRPFRHWNTVEKSGVPVILVSSKTRAEMDVLRRQLKLSTPFVSENGGGVFFPRRKPLEDAPDGAFNRKRLAEWKQGLWQWSLGTPTPI